GMWQREEEIFGSTDFPSPLAVRVTGWSRAELFDPSDGRVLDRFGPVAYALFASIENSHKVAKEGIRFDLTLDTVGEDALSRRRAAQNAKGTMAGKEKLPMAVSPIGPDVQTALRTWLAFGGLGGRTRRGCGALFSKVVGGDLPTIPGKSFVGRPQTSALDAW